MRDHRKETSTGFMPTSPDIGLGLAANPCGGIAISNNTTVLRIRAWINQKQLFVQVPNMRNIRCVFTGEPIGEENKFSFIRCKGSNNKARTRVVMCLASCPVDPERYEVLRIENGGIALFKIAVANMMNTDVPIDRSLYVLKSASHEAFVSEERPRRARERRSALVAQFAPT